MQGVKRRLLPLVWAKKTLVMATCLETVAFCACNPSIGGTAKGQIVREIDALGGEMAKTRTKPFYRCVCSISAKVRRYTVRERRWINTGITRK